LAAATEAVGHGNLDAKLAGPFSDDEVGRLARQFNTMLAELKSNIERRIREEASRREVEGELKAARVIQASLLPAMLPPDPDRAFALHAVNAPARQVAGDFFDFFFVDERRVALVMADVSGKGLPAAMYMAVARTRLRDHATADRSPADVVSEVNRRLAQENDQGMFVSLFLGYYDVPTGVLTYANGGHNPPYVVRTDGALSSLDPTGPLVAPFPFAVFRNAQCQLDPGDLLVLFTDGITEAGVRDGDLFGESRLEQLLCAGHEQSVDQLCRSLVATASDFSGGELADDVTVLALRRLPHSAVRLPSSAGCQPAQVQSASESREPFTAMSAAAMRS
jgi:sigma-B regulation protein RsbU (phosphoserine phosphatase)